MKRLLLLLACLGTFGMNAQVTVFEDSFESYTDFSISGFGGWLTIDLDGLPTYTGGLPDNSPPEAFWPNAHDPQAWMVFNPTAALVSNSTDACTPAGAENRDFNPHTGFKYAASWASVPDDPPLDRNNDWLISPPISLGASNNNVSFWVKQLSTCYGTEIFRVGVYTGSGTPTGTDITPISGFQPVQATTTWEQKTYSLDAYSNQTIRIGIRNISVDAYLLMVDDFLVTSSNLATNDVLSAKFSTYPNPANDIVRLANAENISVNKIEVTDLNGRTVKTMNFTEGPATIEINVADLSSGMYMMNISSDQGKAVKKIIKN